MSLAPWRSLLAHALYRNRSLPNARYLQLATIGLDGRPRNRTVVFRGFLASTDQLQIVTDSRSQKVLEINHQPWGEVCWYFPKTREQFRLAGQLTLVSHQTTDPILQSARFLAWQQLSDLARIQFAWPTPKHPLNTEKEAFQPPLPDKDQPLIHFCLLLLDPLEVDHLELRGEPQNRCLYSLDHRQNWVCEMVNP
ncbi:Npun_F5749 family FMN-dependent PPOX-type flavoprotein [Gloeocapsa sp. PCC 73106]|uniref:Npun_F5749 family FMN-dependent PPOX-type flavoprotein n=1 Tax=Gloeocapsa sp. PCC 73106 TaxID=102232 RepID=UPI0002ABF2CD|nr:FMN-dependent protein [Gloeocapsa sp. PCC 73106]ELR98887.1 PPOX class probable FMN-dependent enzyme, alr4036 family [Gloeocapsa sp. PCC 73106]